MNIMRNLRLNRIVTRQCLRFYCKGIEESKKCADIKATSVCSKGTKDTKNTKNTKNTKKDTKQKVTLIEGDGVGCELVGSLQEVCCAANVPVEWESFCEHVKPNSDKVLPELIASLKCNKVGIKGPIKSLAWQKHLRKLFDLYAYVAVCHNLEGQNNPYGLLDCVIIRDIMEGEYSGIEHSVVPGVLQSIKVSTAAGARRVARFVFKYAKNNDRKKITVAHKANIMALTDGNFLTEMRKEAVKHMDDYKFEERYMDTACLNLVMNPELMDVLVSSSMYGDVLVMMAGSIMGGKALCPGYGVSSNGLLFDTLNRTNHEIAGKDLINPTGILLSAVLMLRHLKLDSHADEIECAIKKVYKDTDIRTKDLGGKAKCSEFTKAVCDNIGKE